ncbi:MAG: carboxylating nicotinate-nucleotide diphosphorylase [Clostridiales bacterium]|nr:carboxylating nicotinate-nucleotide diphosphorylase [Clostridiales bacterium]
MTRAAMPPADDLLARALAEDFGVVPEVFLGGGVSDVLARDVTTAALVGPDVRYAGRLVCREAGVVCGIGYAARVWELLAAASGRRAPSVIALAEDGEHVTPGTAVARVEGSAAVVLGGERTALNVIMVLSGIATEAARWQKAAGSCVTVLDTRKTLPGLRTLSKWAVKIGGATPHRAGLWDMLLIKDNHLRLAGGVPAAVQAAHGANPGMIVAVEADTVSHAIEAARAGADIVILDNLDDPALTAAVAAVRHESSLTGKRVFTEASGGVTLGRFAQVVATGVDRVSTSALALARPLDLGLDEDPQGGV